MCGIDRIVSHVADAFFPPHTIRCHPHHCQGMTEEEEEKPAERGKLNERPESSNSSVRCCQKQDQISCLLQSGLSVLIVREKLRPHLAAVT